MMQIRFSKWNKMWIALISCFLWMTSSAFAIAPGEGIPSPSGPLSSVSTYAGTGAYDDADVEVAARQAAFRFPRGLAVLADGSVLVSDSENQVIRQIKDGNVTVYAGFLSPLKDAMGIPAGALIDGTVLFSSFQSPAGLAVDTDGNVYVADAGNHAIRKIDTDGNVTTVAGTGDEGYRDGAAHEAQFHSPTDVAVGEDGTLYVADAGNHAIRKVTVEGEVTTLNALPEREVELAPGEIVVAGDYRDGNLDEALFNEPYGLVLDAKGNLIVSDSGNQVIRYIDLSQHQVSTIAGAVPEYEADALYAVEGYADGDAGEARFNFPKGIALTADGGIVIADSLNHAVRFLNDASVTTLAGNPSEGYGFQNGVNDRNLLHYPTGIAVTEHMILIADAYNHTVRAYTLYELPENAAAVNRLKIVYADAELAMEGDVTLSQGRTMVSAQALAEALGWEAQFDSGHKSDAVTYASAGRTVVFTVGSKTAVVTDPAGNESKVEMDISPIASEGHVLVPVRYAAEIFGLHVGWDAASQTVILR